MGVLGWHWNIQKSWVANRVGGVDFGPGHLGAGRILELQIGSLDLDRWITAIQQPTQANADEGNCGSRRFNGAWQASSAAANLPPRKPELDPTRGLRLHSEQRTTEIGMEMGMRAKEDTDIAEDITPPIPPLSFSLYDSLLLSHCSSCYSPLPSHPFSPFPRNPHRVPFLLYCSPLCSASDSPLHFSSAEHHLLLQPPCFADSSDLRAALRFLHSQRATCRSALHSRRVAGLLVNREKLSCRGSSEDAADELCEKIRIGARAMAAAITMQRGVEESDDAVLEEATVALCLVLTNAVEVQDNRGRTLGIAVYDPTFCWINHSCSPNACYRIVLSSHSSPNLASHGEVNLRIAPFTRDSRDGEIDSGFYCSSSELAKEEKQGYGPRIIVRSIKRIKKGEEVTVAYTDLLQPKELRQSELWSKYRFICQCERCSALPFTYVDHALQAISAVNIDSSGAGSSYKYYRDKAVRKLTEYIDDVLSEYLSVGDPESCCEKLENILTQGFNEQLEGNEGQSQSTFTLHPLHHLSLNSYTTLASAYKVRVSELLSLYSVEDENQLKAFDMSRISAAYSLLLASATHHLFHSESSLIPSVANFWIGAGESLLSLARSSGWYEFVKWDPVVSNLSSVAKLKCSNCSVMDKFRACASNGQVKSADFEILYSEFLHCITNLTQKVWSFLVYGCHFLRSFKVGTLFSWLLAAKNSTTSAFWTHVNRTDMGSSHESEVSNGVVEDQGYTEHGRAHIFHLGAHCLVYGGVLTIICYGHNSHLTCHVQSIMDCAVKEIS